MDLTRRALPWLALAVALVLLRVLVLDGTVGGIALLLAVFPLVAAIDQVLSAAGITTGWSGFGGFGDGDGGGGFGDGDGGG